MGYTHYWRIKQGTDSEKLNKAVADMCRICRAKNAAAVIAGWDGEQGSTPELGPDSVRFNGIEEKSHETFRFPGNLHHHSRGRSFDFCKTARKPYDFVVVACLAAAADRLGDDIQVESNGDAADWAEGVSFASTVLDRYIANPLYTEEVGDE